MNNIPAKDYFDCIVIKQMLFQDSLGLVKCSIQFLQSLFLYCVYANRIESDTYIHLNVDSSFKTLK